jgi:hypothetical protein
MAFSQMACSFDQSQLLRKPERRSKQLPQPRFDNCFLRAGTEACPYTENVVNGNGDLSSIVQSQPLRKPEPMVKPIPYPRFENRYLWAGVAARPYGDFSTIRTQLVQSQLLRDAWWNVEWACLKAYPSEHDATIPAMRPPA